MPNGKYILNDLEFNTRIKSMGDRELSEFTAKLSYSNAIRIMSLEGKNKKVMAASGGAGALITGIAVGVIEYFRRSG